MFTREGLGAAGYQIVFALLDQLEKSQPGITKNVVQAIIDNNKAVLENGPNTSAQETLEILEKHVRW